MAKLLNEMKLIDVELKRLDILAVVFLKTKQNSINSTLS